MKRLIYGSAILPGLPSPGSGVPVANKALANAHVIAYLRKKLANGEVKEERNGGRAEIELGRFPELANNAEGNPWRIIALTALPVWSQLGKEFWGAE